MYEQTYKFWLTWGVNLAVAVATILVVVAALFGDLLRAKWFPPQLKLSVLNRNGEKCPLTIRSAGITLGSVHERTEQARFYHLQVSNSRRWSAATNTQVFLTSITLPAPNREFENSWHGEVPMRWKHYELSGRPKNLGHAAVCDLLSVVKGQALEIHTAFSPNNLTPFLKWAGPINLFTTFVAISDQIDSEIFEVEIHWDGQWEDDDAAMSEHLLIKHDRLSRHL